MYRSGLLHFEMASMVTIYECKDCYAILPVCDFIHNCPDDVQARKMDPEYTRLLNLFFCAVKIMMNAGGKINIVTC